MPFSMSSSEVAYRDVLGLRVTADKIEEFPQGPGQAPAQRRAVYLRWVDGPHASFVVLDQQITNEIKGEPAQLFQMGCHHFAFWVDDIDEMMERVRAAGITVVMGGDDGPGADTVDVRRATGRSRAQRVPARSRRATTSSSTSGPDEPTWGGHACGEPRRYAGLRARRAPWWRDRELCRSRRRCGRASTPARRWSFNISAGVRLSRPTRGWERWAAPRGTARATHGSLLIRYSGPAERPRRTPGSARRAIGGHRSGRPRPPEPRDPTGPPVTTPRDPRARWDGSLLDDVVPLGDPDDERGMEEVATAGTTVRTHALTVRRWAAHRTHVGVGAEGDQYRSTPWRDRGRRRPGFGDPQRLAPRASCWRTQVPMRSWATAAAGRSKFTKP